MAIFHVAIPNASEAIAAVAQVCGAHSSAVAIETHLSHATLALMRLKQGELRIRKSISRPRDINQLAKRIVDIATGEDEDRKTTPEQDGRNSAAHRKR